MKTKFGIAAKSSSKARNGKRTRPVPAELPKAKSIDEIWLENFRRLMGYDLATGRSKIPQTFMVPRIAQATIGRLLRGDNQPNLVTLNVIAHEFQVGGGLLQNGGERLEGWQLLIEGFDPVHPPRIVTPDHLQKLREVIQPIFGEQAFTIAKKPSPTNTV